MFSCVLGLLEGKSLQKISGGDSQKLKFLTRIQVILQVLRAVLILLGITLLALGITGTLGLPGTVAGGVVLAMTFGLFIPLLIPFIKRRKIAPKLFQKTLEQAKKSVEEIEAYASTNKPDEWKAVLKDAEEAMRQCHVESLSQEFHLPMLLWRCSEKVKILPPDMKRPLIEIQAYYLITMTALQHFNFLVKKSVKRERALFKRERQMFGSSFSDSILALGLYMPLPKTCFGMQAFRGSIKGMYRAYIQYRKQIPVQAFITEGTPYYEMRMLYNDLLDQCQKVFSIEELKRLNDLKANKLSVEEQYFQMANADLLIQILSHPDKSKYFPSFELLNSDIERGNPLYDRIWA